MCITRKLFVLLALLVLVTCQGNAYSSVAWRDSSTFSHHYEGDAYPVPYYNESAGTLASITSNAGVLSYETSSTENKWWMSSSWASQITPTSGYTIEARVKMYSTPAMGSGGGFVIYAGDGTSANMVFIHIYAHEVSSWQFSGGWIQHDIETGDNTDTFHTFQISVESASGKVQIWRDGVQIGTDMSTLNNWGENVFYWGDDGGAVSGKVDVDYVRWDPIASNVTTQSDYNHYEGDVYPVPYYTESGSTLATPISQDGSVLSYVTSSTENKWWTSTEWSKHITATSGYTIEAKMKINPTLPMGTGGEFEIYAGDGTRQGMLYLAFYTDKIVARQWAPWGDWNFQEIPTGDNTDTFHIFKISTAGGSGKFQIWRDDVQVGTDVASLNTWTESVFYFGDGAGNVYGGVDIDYIRWDACVSDTIKYSDDVSINGNLDDWSDADWKPFDQTYAGNPTDIGDGSAWAVKWGAGGTKLYLAVKVNDSAHFFTDSYTAWDGRDAAEMYIHTTGTGPTFYSEFQEQAQQWGIGIKDTNHNAVWTSVGDPITYGNYATDPSEINAVGRVDGDWLYYEVAITPYEYFGGRKGLPSIISPLHEADVIGTDVVVVGHSATAFTGMVSSGHNEGGWHGNYSLFAQHKLVRPGIKGTITLQDFGGSTLLAAAQIVITDAENVSETHNLVLDGSGAYSFKTALSGNCTATASAAGYASQSLPVTVTDSNGDVSFTLTKSVAIDTSIADAKKMALGSVVKFTGSITAVFGNSIYVETSDRVSGIRVDKTDNGLTSNDVGKVVDVTGELAKDSTDELYINASLINPTGTTTILKPLGLTNKTAGGGDFVDTLGNGQVGVDGGTGLNNIGLLVRTTGLASAGNSNGFTLTDGSGVTLFVSLAGAGTTYNGKYVTVTGISSLGSGGVRIIKALSALDVQIIN